MQPLRQGDVILLPFKKIAGKKLSHLTLAEGEVTGHSHRISEGQAELYEQDGILYLSVLSKTAWLTHEEHQALPIPQGNWMIRIQREYAPQKRKSAALQREDDTELSGNLIPQVQKIQTPSSSQSAQLKQGHVVSPKRRSKTESGDDLMSPIQKLPNSLPDSSSTSRSRRVAPQNWRHVVD
jgi:hypothetical protein